ncbi:MAG TPA: cytochrome c [Nitrospiria bacterium]|jgi:mono/diheme cytochrome c family protein|nr:cytochrome c [Nitrospiria bacterium]
MLSNIRGILFAVLILGLGIWILPASGIDGDASKGRPIYEKNCLICHGPQGRGDGPMGKSLNPPAPNFASPESRRKPDADLLKAIREGHPDTAMTAWKGTLSEQQFLDVLSYVRALSQGVEKDKS